MPRAPIHSFPQCQPYRERIRVEKRNRRLYILAAKFLAICLLAGVAVKLAVPWLILEGWM